MEFDPKAFAVCRFVTYNFSSINIAKIEEEIDRQIQEKTIQIKNTKLTLTKKGMLYADLIAEKFFVI